MMQLLVEIEKSIFVVVDSCYNTTTHDLYSGVHNCDEIVCENGGTCQMTVDSYYCAATLDILGRSVKQVCYMSQSSNILIYQRVSILKKIQQILYFCWHVCLGLCFDTDVSLPSNGDRSCAYDGFDMSCVVSCDSGYHLDKSTNQSIEYNCSNGVWDSQNIQRSCKCVISCQLGLSVIYHFFCITYV